MKKTPFILSLTAVLMIISVYAVEVSNLRVQPNTTATETDYYAPLINNLTLYFVYNDTRFNYIGPWAGGIFRNSNHNTSMRPSSAWYSFDYDNVTVFRDLGTREFYLDGVRTMYDDGITHYYSMESDNDTHVWDYSSLVNHGRYNNTAFNYSDCVNGRCITFNGLNTSINIQKQDYNLTNFSVSFWSKRAEGHKDKTRQVIFGNASDDISFIIFEGGNLELALETNVNGDLCRSTTYTNDTSWHHYVISVFNYTCTIYEDSVNITNGAESKVIGNLTLQYIGKSLTDYWNGTLDEVYIYNRSLTETEVRHLYNDSNHRGYSYRFDGVNDYMTIPDDTSMESQNLTLSFWAYHHNASASGGGVGKGQLESTAVNQEYEISFSSGKAFAVISNGLSKNVPAGVPIPGNQWNHWLMTVNDTEIALFLNGEYKEGQTRSIGNIDYTSAKDFHIGGRTDGLGSLNGLIDDVILFNHSLSIYDVKVLYNNTKSSQINLFIPLPGNGTYLGNLTYWGVDDFYNAVNTTRLFDNAHHINSLDVDDCSTNTFKILNYSYFWEQDAEEFLTAQAEVTGKVYTTDYPFNDSIFFNISIGLQTEAKSHALCMATNDSVITDLEIIYNTPGGYTHSYIYRNHTFDSLQDNLSLFNYNSTAGVSDLKATIRSSEDYSLLKNVIVSLQRQYITDDSTLFRTVQMDETGDLGLSFFNVIEETETYKLIFLDRVTNRVLKQTQNMKFVCVDGVCDFVFTVPPVSDGQSITELSVNITYNAVNNEINATWEDPTGVTSSITLIVTKETLASSTQICNVGAAGSSGSVTCDVTGYSGSLKAEVYAGASPEQFYEYLYFLVNTSTLYNILDAQGLGDEAHFWTFGILAMIITAAVIGFGATAGIVVTAGGIFLISFLGLASFFSISVLVLMFGLLAFVAWRGKSEGL